MTADALEIFLSQNQNYKCVDDIDSGFLLFRNENLPKYKNNSDFSRGLSYSDVEKMTENELSNVIDCGYKVENITRITGYMTKISTWNKGKLGELKDRRRTDLAGRPCVSMRELCEIQERVACG